MSKKPDTASALAGILRARRGDDPGAAPDVPEAPPAPPPPQPPPPEAGARGGKSADRANYRQCSVYLRKDTRKRVGRALDDAETGQDFSDLVQTLLEQWLASRT